MAYSKLEKMVIEMAEPIAAANDCYIYDVEYIKEGGVRYLRIYADKENVGISIDECEIINRALGEELDKCDPIKENYILEVSSPGIERKLRNPEHFEMYLGETVDIGLFKGINGEKSVTGLLKSFLDGCITVELQGEDVSIMQSETTFVKLHFDF